ncbi:hypothetical protein C7402_111273 [Paraburkholderia unamae]|uniref:Uncharacterized protein n=2 Tax=Paraburkholderia unamae TaxID=219649 RepID=A0ABX5KIX6_9BURK|nr:hypothetical protein [Paraburkholderia unamae]PVX81371.1 hypothetical protein C7402_111273 [Paraburkholderia unamae]RAR57178.1 hypothetical protein C7401_11657 [Paraburkholderia unamae]
MTDIRELTMHAFAELVMSVSPPLMVSIAFGVAYLLVGMPFHVTQGPGSRDGYGTMAGLLASLIYIAFAIGYRSEFH